MSQEWSKRYNFDPKCCLFLPDTLKVTGSTISTPKSYGEHPCQVKYGSPTPPPLWDKSNIHVKYENYVLVQQIIIVGDDAAV